MLRFLPAMLLVLLATLAKPAAGLDAGQAAAIDRLAAAPPAGTSVAAAMAGHYAVLLWVDDYCNGKSLESVRAYIQKKGSVDADAFEAAWLEAAGMLAKTDAAAMCALALQQYGPDGVLIRGAWAKR